MARAGRATERPEGLPAHSDLGQGSPHVRRQSDRPTAIAHAGNDKFGADQGFFAAARVLAEGLSRRSAADGARGVVLLDAAPSPGGSYLCQPDPQARSAPAAIAAARAAGVEILSGTAAIGFYGEEATSAAPSGHRGLLVAASTSQLYKLSAERFVYATGGHLRNALFVDNDRPGVMPARAVGLLLGEYGVLPTAQPLVVGSDEYAGELAGAERGGAVGRLLAEVWPACAPPQGCGPLSSQVSTLPPLVGGGVS